MATEESTPLNLTVDPSASAFRGSHIFVISSSSIGDGGLKRMIFDIDKADLEASRLRGGGGHDRER